MENSRSLFGSLFENAHNYLDSKIDLLKLKAINKSCDVTSSVASGLIILSLIVMSLFLFNFGISFWLGTILGETWYGFFALGGFYILLTIALYLFRKKWLKLPLNDIIVKKFLTDDDYEN